MFIITHLEDYVKKGTLSMNDTMNDTNVMRIKFINELISLNLSLKKYFECCDWDMFSYTYKRRSAYLDIAFKLDLITYKEYEKIKFDDKFELFALY